MGTQYFQPFVCFQNISQAFYRVVCFCIFKEKNHATPRQRIFHMQLQSRPSEPRCQPVVPQSRSALWVPRWPQWRRSSRRWWWRWGHLVYMRNFVPVGLWWSLSVERHHGLPSRKQKRAGAAAALTSEIDQDLQREFSVLSNTTGSHIMRTALLTFCRLC